MSLGFLCSAIFKSYRLGVIGAAAVLIGSYGLMFFVQNIDMPTLNFLSPLTYFSVSDVVANGLGILYVFISVAVILACMLCTQRIYSRKEMIT
jgi:hypothetical protein